MERKLKTGCAYHGNRMLSHAMADMKEIANADMDIVVHMLSHTDWERHDKVMGDIFRASEAEGLEVWVDNWGLGGSPGDKSHFLSYHPEAHSYYGDGIMHPYQVCLNAPSYRQFVKDWIDRVSELGGKTVFWDEPFIPEMKAEDGRYYSACTCPICKKLFREKYGKEMPVIMDADVGNFRNETTVDFYSFVSNYAHSAGIKNAICFMPYQLKGLKHAPKKSEFLEISLEKICSMEHIDNIGSDPYWFGSAESMNPYEKVLETSSRCVEVANQFGKDHNIWIQGYNAPMGREEEIIIATEAAYDGGARTVLSWGFHGCEANNYRSKNPARSWLYTVEGLKRIKSMERDKILAENRKRCLK